MFFSDRFILVYEDAPATLTVLRNDGYCWGRLVTDGRELDVVIDDDLYDEPDWVVARALAQAIENRTATIEPALRPM